jgi:hypothetical protein
MVFNTTRAATKDCLPPDEFNPYAPPKQSRPAPPAGNYRGMFCVD